jgi:hypothetical protein
MNRRLWFVLCAVLSGLAAPARAQQRPVSPRDSAAAADSTSRDSLAARLARAEAAIDLLRKQLAVEAATVVRTRSRLQVELSARILTNAFLTDSRANSVDVPQFALPSPVIPAQPIGGTPGVRAAGLSLRQSRVGAALSVDSVLGATFESDFELDFFGGVSAGPGDRRLFPEPRLRTARAQLRWHRTTVFVGSETPLISDLNPISLAAVGIPEFVTAGNLWNWIPQVRVSHDIREFSNGARIGVQGALLSPFSGAQHIAETDAVDAGERSGRPFVEGRLHVRWGRNAEQSGAASDVAMGESGGEIGVGVHRGWLRSSGDSLTASSAVSLDARVLLLPRVELRGEAYTGQLLRGLGGGAIGQTFGRAAAGDFIGRPLRDTAGWLQLNVQATTTLITGAGCGRDDVNRDDAPTRYSNSVCAAHLLWRPAQPIVLGLEFRSIHTQYIDRTNRANHLNLSFGFEL